MESGLKLGRSDNAVKAFFFLNIVNIPKPAADEVISGERCPRPHRVIRGYAAGAKLRFGVVGSAHARTHARTAEWDPARGALRNFPDDVNRNGVFVQGIQHECPSSENRSGLSSEPEA